jgi:hypothetical protein
MSSKIAPEQVPVCAAICAKLNEEINAALPAATSKIWHGSPVWFMGENPVVGYSVTSKHVNLLFWSGQLFGDQALQPAGKFKAAQTQFGDVSEINLKLLRSWLRKARTKIWDYAGILAEKRIAAKAAKTKRSS